MSAKEKNDTTKVSFKLKREHTHQGEECKPGDTITLRKYQADRLAEAGAGEIVDG